MKTQTRHTSSPYTLHSFSTLKAYAGATLGRKHSKGLACYFEICPWCKSTRYTLKTYVQDGKGRCKCTQCGRAGDIFDLAGAYISYPHTRDFAKVKAHILDRLKRLERGNE